MKRIRFALLGLLMLGMAQLAPAADSPAKGAWKISFPLPTRNGEVPLNILVLISESKGKWVADVLDMSPQINVEPTIPEIKIQDDTVKFDLMFGPQPMSFDGKFTKDGKTLKGSLIVLGRPNLLEIYPSKLKNLKDEFAVSKEILDQQEGQAFFGSLVPVLKQAGKKGLKAEEVRSYADRAMKEAEPYGGRWQRTMALGIASALADQEPYSGIALEQAKLAERMLTPADDGATTLSVLDTLSTVLKKAKKPDEAKKVDAQIVKAEARDYAEYAKKAPFKPEPFAGRKAKSDRVVLVELFTGSECPPCVGVDMAFEALDLSYKPTEVVLMQYHLHIPAPDPMTSKDTEARANFYKVESTPSIFLSGKAGPPGGGAANAAKAKNKSYREAIDEQLEKPAAAKLQLTAAMKGSEITLTAKVEDLKTPGEKVMLRFALVEERVRYAGGNGLRYHHAVVRALPGGTRGTPLTKAGQEATAKINLDELKASLNKYLDDYVKEALDDFPDRPLNLKNLKAIAFIQDDATSEVVQAVQVELEEK